MSMFQFDFAFGSLVIIIGFEYSNVSYWIQKYESRKKMNHSIYLNLSYSLCT